MHYILILSYPPLCSVLLSFSVSNSVFSFIILHFSDVLDSHTCAALAMAENDKVKIQLYNTN